MRNCSYFFEAEETFPLEENTSSVQELMTMVGSADIVENNPPLSPIFEKVAAEKGGLVSGVDGLETEPKTFHCNHCDSTFNTKKGLTIHTRKLHKAEEAFPSESDTSTSVAPAPSTDALKRKADFQSKSTEEQSKRSKNEEDEEYVDDTEEEKEERTTYPHNYWPQVKLEPLEKFPYILGWQVHKNSIMKNKLEQLHQEKGVVVAKIRELADQLKEQELKKKEELESRQAEMSELLGILEEEKIKKQQLQIEKENLEEEIKIEKELKIQMKNNLDAMEEELKMLRVEKTNAVRENKDLHMEVKLRKEDTLQSINRLMNLDNTIKAMLINSKRVT